MNIINTDDDGNTRENGFSREYMHREEDILMRMCILRLSRASIKRFVSFRVRAVARMMFCRTRHIIYSRRRVFYVPHLEYLVYGVSE